MREAAHDLLHFVLIAVYLSSAHGVMLHILFGATVERLSTFGKAQVAAVEFHVNGGSPGDLMEQIEANGYMVSTQSAPLAVRVRAESRRYTVLALLQEGSADWPGWRTLPAS